MRKKQFLAAILLGLSFCFMSGVGYGEIEEWMIEAKTSYIEGCLLDARIDYIMLNPTSFLKVDFYYDSDGLNFLVTKDKLIVTTGKIFITIRDTRGQFSYKIGVALLDVFKRELEVTYSFVRHVATDMNYDIVAKFYSKGDIPLGYFYEGEYHLWDE